MLCGDKLRLDYMHLTLFWAMHAEGLHDICLAQQCIWLLTSVVVFSCLWVVAAHRLCWLDSMLLCMKCVYVDPYRFLHCLRSYWSCSSCMYECRCAPCTAQPILYSLDRKKGLSSSWIFPLFAKCQIFIFRPLFRQTVQFQPKSSVFCTPVADGH